MSGMHLILALYYGKIDLQKLRDQYLQETSKTNSRETTPLLEIPNSSTNQTVIFPPPPPPLSTTDGGVEPGTSPGSYSLDRYYARRRPRDITFSTTSAHTFSTSHTSSEELTPPSPGVPDLDDDSNPAWKTTEMEEAKLRTMSDLQIEPNATVEDLLAMYKETEALEEQGDILHYLAYTKGIQFDTKLGPDVSCPVTVKDLLKDLYERACKERKWALVRHIAGILGKRVEDLAKAVADIIVRQKQLTIGMPPTSEHTITRPIPSKELRQIINKAHGGDQSTAMLTQELLVFLAMFIRTEPQLFSEMLRLRVGLVIQVMASELGRALKCSGQEASEHLLNLSPYEMKMLLHHILSGKEFGVKGGNYFIVLLVS